MFIPHEVKQKLEDLEKEVKRLNLENQDLRNTPLAQPAKKSMIPALLGVLLVISIALNLYLYKNQTVVVEDNTEYLDSVTFYWDNQLVNMSTMPQADVFYSVQIGAYEDFDLKPYRINLDELVEDTTNAPFTKMVLGRFSNVLDAQDFQQEMARLGLVNAYIVAHKNDVPFGVLDAEKLRDE